MKKSADFIKISGIIILTAYCIFRIDSVKHSVYEALMRCLETVIPSLYGMMIMTGIMSAIGFFGQFSGSLPIFVISQFAGYPVGAKLLCAEADKGRISASQADAYMSACFGAGPAFVFGCISSKLYGTSAVGIIITASAVSANLLIYLYLHFKTDKLKNQSVKTPLKISAELITESVLSSGKAMAEICFMITGFSVISCVAEETGILEYFSILTENLFHIQKEKADGILRGILDVTDIPPSLSGDFRLLPIISGLVSFGGICVIMQVKAVAGERLSLMKFIFVRIISAILSGIICRITANIFLDRLTVSAGNFSVHKSETPIPSVMLILMTLFLFAGMENERKNN